MHRSFSSFIVQSSRFVAVAACVMLPLAHEPAWGADVEIASTTRTDSLTLDRALALVVERHPAIVAARARVRAAEAEREQAGAWANPRLGFDAEGLGAEGRPALEPEEFTASIEWPLTSLLTRGPLASVADAQVEWARAGLLRVTWELEGATRIAYHDALVADRRVTFSEQRVDLTGRTVDAFRAQVEAGKASPIELLRAEVEHETARSELASAGAELRAAHRVLAALWSEAPPAPLALSGALREGVALDDLAALEQRLTERHPVLIESRWSAEIERRGERVAGRERWPELAPRVGVRWLPAAGEQDLVAGVGLELPLFDRRDARRRAAARRTEAATADVEAVLLELRTRLRIAVEELRAHARTLADYDERIVPRAQDALERVRIGQAAGKFGALELLDAQRALVAAEEGHFRAHVDHDRIVVEIESLLGEDIRAAVGSRHLSPTEENQP